MAEKRLFGRGAFLIYSCQYRCYRRMKEAGFFEELPCNLAAAETEQTSHTSAGTEMVTDSIFQFRRIR